MFDDPDNVSVMTIKLVNSRTLDSNPNIIIQSSTQKSGYFAKFLKERT